MENNLSSTDLDEQLKTAANAIAEGGIIAYPTEGVFGLGCSPFNEAAVKKLCQLKNRPLSKGLIVIARDFAELESLTLPLPHKKLDAVLETWPGAVTWVFPASAEAPRWVTGEHTSIALRVPSFSLLQQLCALTGPLISTSANISSQPAATSAHQVSEAFRDCLDYIVDASTGMLDKPTPIYLALNGKRVRA